MSQTEGQINSLQKGTTVTLTRFSAVAALVVLTGGGLLAQAANPLVGTWKLNPEKSKNTTFKSGTTKVDAEGDALKFTVDLQGSDGKAWHWSFAAKLDGKDVPVTGESPYGESAALTRVDAHTTRVTVKHGGKATVTQTMVVSADGKTRTITTKGVDAKGQPMDSVSVYERQ